jgi:hypothetical protein
MMMQPAQRFEATEGLPPYPRLQPSHLQDISTMMRPVRGFEAQYQMIEQPLNRMSTSTTMRETFEALTLAADMAVIPPHMPMQGANTYPLEIPLEEQPQQLPGASPSQNLEAYADWAESALMESLENAST